MFNIGGVAHNQYLEVCLISNKKLLRRIGRQAFKNGATCPVFVSPFHLLLEYSPFVSMLPKRKKSFLCHSSKIEVGQANLKIINIPKKRFGIRVVQGDHKSPNLLCKNKPYEFLFLN